MAESVKLRREIHSLGKDLGYEGDKLDNYMRVEFERIKEEEAERKKEEEAERKREEAERKREEEEAIRREEKVKEEKRRMEEREKEVAAEIRREEKEAEIRREEKEAERRREEREAEIRREEREDKLRREDREYQLRMKELELQAHRPQNGQDTRPLTPTPSLADPAMTFALEPFNEKAESIDIYLERFETLAEEFHLDPTKWTLKLSQALRGAAYDTYSKLPPSRKTDFQELKQNLLRQYELTADSYRKKFRGLRCERGETFAQFACRLDTCLHKWLALSPFDDTFPGLVELIITDQLREAMTPELRRFASEQGAVTLHDIVTYADRYVAARELDKPQRPKPHDGNPLKNVHQPHPLLRSGTGIPRDRPPTMPPTRRYCSYCKMNNHSTQECRRIRGHTAAICQPINPPLTSPMDPPSSDPNPPVTEPVQVNGHRITCLYDTGLSFDAVVRESLVEPSQLTGDTVSLQGPDLTAPGWTLPLAQIEVASRYVTGIITAAVMPRPAYDLILGCRYVFLGTPMSPIVVGAVQTRFQASTDDRPTPPLNPLPQQMKDSQKSDPSLAGCFKKIPSAHSPPQQGDFFTKGGLLYRQSAKDHKQLVVPNAFREQVLEMGHAIPFSGHMGAGATSQHISAHYYWPGVNEEVKSFARPCPQGQKVSPQSYNNHAKNRRLRVKDKAVLLPTDSNPLQLSWNDPSPVTDKMSRSNNRRKTKGKHKTHPIHQLRQMSRKPTADPIVDDRNRRRGSRYSKHVTRVTTHPNRDRDRWYSRPQTQPYSSQVPRIKRTNDPFAGYLSRHPIPDSQSTKPCTLRADAPAFTPVTPSKN